MFAAATVGVHGVGGIGIADFGRARHHRGVFGADHVFGWWFVIERMTSPFLGDAHAPILGVVAVGMFVGSDTVALVRKAGVRSLGVQHLEQAVDVVLPVSGPLVSADRKEPDLRQQCPRGQRARPGG